MRIPILLVAALLVVGCVSTEKPSAPSNASTPSSQTPASPSTTPASPTPFTPSGTPPTGSTPGIPTPPADMGNLTGPCAPAPNAPCAVVETSIGNFTATLFADKAPLSVANFLQDAQDGLYDGTVFHRVVKGFVIQGGGFAAPFNGTRPPRDQADGPIPTEIWNGNHHAAGTLGMARTQNPDSGSNQWFVNTKDNGGLDTGYTVFGNVTSGMDVVHAIEDVPVMTKGGAQDAPVNDVVIRHVTVAVVPTPALPSLKSYHSALAVAPGGEVSTPLFVKNVGGQRLVVNLTGSAGAGIPVDFPRVPVPLSSGEAGVAILHVKVPSDFTGGAVDITATGPGGNATVHIALTVLKFTGNAAGPDHGAVQTYYLGLYDNGVIFDTTMTGMRAAGFPTTTAFQEHPAPLKVWVGNGSAASGYTPVIPGFASGIVGLHAGETRTVRLTSEEGYADGYFRLFEMTVRSVDS